MATVYVDEFADMVQVGNGTGNIAKMPPLRSQTQTIGGASAQLALPFMSGAIFIRVFTDTACCVAFGANPTAVVTAMPMAANQTEYFAIQGGDKFAVISR